MTDRELLKLLLDEGRAFVATFAAAERNDRGPAARGLLKAWHTKQAELRKAVLDRLEDEQGRN